MGILDNGPFGHLRGRVGNLVSYTLKGKNVMRVVGKNTKPPTPAKLANYQRMKVVNEFLKPSLGFLNMGFALAVEGTMKNPYNEAVSYNKINALQGEYPEIRMDYSKALVSKGSLPPALSPAITVSPGKIELTWDIQDDLDSRFKYNRVMFLLFFPEIKAAKFELSGARRIEGRDTIELDPYYHLQPVQAYISFIADDKMAVSDSVWVKI